MKTLIFIHGPNGVGKSTACARLHRRLPGSARLESEWCRMINPFTFTPEVEALTERNMTHLLRGYLECSTVDHIIFTWGLHGPRQRIWLRVLDNLRDLPFHLLPIVLTCSEEENIRRMTQDGRIPERIRYALQARPLPDREPFAISCPLTLLLLDHFPAIFFHRGPFRHPISSPVITMKTDDLCETELVRRARGDLEAFGELVERLREPIQRQCRQRVGNWHDAEDLAQEAFVRAWLKLDTLDDPARFVPWLRRIAANLCRDFLRSPARREIADDRLEAQDSLPDLDELPLAHLPEETRRCLLLFYQAGCSYAEIARALGSTVPAVKARLGRAKVILRKEMGAMDEQQRSPFTRRVLEKLEALRSDEASQRARAAGELQQGLGEDHYAQVLRGLHGEFPPKVAAPECVAGAG